MLRGFLGEPSWLRRVKNIIFIREFPTSLCALVIVVKKPDSDEELVRAMIVGQALHSYLPPS